MNGAKIKSFILSTRLKTTPLGMLSVYVGGLVAGAAFDSVGLLLAVLTTYFVTAASMTFNDYFDWEIDRVNHPERPIPQGIIRPKEMLYFSLAFFAIGITISLFINWLCAVIAVSSVLLIALYELYTKNIGIFSNMTVAFVSALAFAFGGAAVDNPFPPLILSIITFFVMTGREIIMDIRDVAGDSSVRRSLPVQLGKTRAAHVALVFLVLAVVLSPVPFLLGILGIWYLIVIVPVGSIISIVVVWMLRDTNNAAISASLIRIGLALALVGFIAGIFY